MVWYKISIHAVLADCDYDVYNRCTQIDISIHAVLADCDTKPSFIRVLGDFNPRSPCGLRRSALDIALLYMKFQSTQSLRTATPICANNLHRIVVFQSTQSLRTATGSLTTFHFISPISIHAVLADCDRWQSVMISPAVLFQSTQSLRTATLVCSRTS